MTESVNWQEWSGRAIDGDVQLQDFLGGSGSNAIFSTTYAGQKAVVRLFMADALQADDQLERLKVAESLNHPHLLKVLRSGRAELEGVNVIYAVKEYAEENLWQVIPQRALTPAEAKDVLQSTTQALGYLHDEGLVHGDVKPGNIMAAGEQLKLGVDNVRRSGGRLDRTAEAHDAPESTTSLSAASDSWSLGMTLIEVLTQRLPVWNPDDNLPPEVPQSVPAPFREIAQHCLLRTPELRWSMKEVAERLSAGEKKPAATPADTPVAPVAKASLITAKRPQRSWRMPIIVAGVIVILVVLVIAITRKLETDSTPQRVASSAASPATESSSATPQPAEQRQVPNDQPPPAKDKDAQVANNTGTSDAAGSGEEAKDSVRSVTSSPEARNPESTESQAGESETMNPSAGAKGVVHQVLPTVSRRALSTITGKVRVKVRVDVDSTGSVIGSDFVNAGPSKYFANAAMDAAKNWKFAPEQTQSRIWDLQFEFRKGDVQVSSSPASR